MSDPTSPVTTIKAGMIDMESNTTLVQCYPAHQAVPEGEGSFPAVVVLHDRFGLTSHARTVTNRLAHAGFYALAPDLYGSPTSVAAVAPDFFRPTVATFFDDSQETEARHRALTLSDERATAIVQQALAYVAGRSKARSGGPGLLGFGMGGRLAFLSSCLFPVEVRGAVSFYPDGLASARPPGGGHATPLDRADSLRAPLLFFYGLLDSVIRPEEREVLRRRLAACAKDFRIEVFPEAGHDFFCEEKDTYRIRVSKAAWKETLSFLGRHVGGGIAATSG